MNRTYAAVTSSQNISQITPKQETHGEQYVTTDSLSYLSSIKINPSLKPKRQLYMKIKADQLLAQEAKLKPEYIINQLKQQLQTRKLEYEKSVQSFIEQTERKRAEYIRSVEQAKQA